MQADIPALARRLQQQKQQAAERYLANRRPNLFFQQYCRTIDRTLAELWPSFFDDGRFCLLAVGGYGRGEVYPHSDTDLTLVSAAPLDAGEEERMAGLVQTLWDLGLAPSLKAGTAAELCESARQDLTADTAFLEARFLCGNAGLAGQFIQTLNAQRHPAAFIEGKLLEMQQRHDKQQGSGALLEPNVKTCPGGLRDIHTMLWLAKAQGIDAGFDALIRQRILTRAEAGILANSHRELAAIRIDLHLAAGREEDRLIFDLQTRLAENILPDGEGGRLKSEKLMHRFYRAAKAVKQLNGIILPMLSGRVYTPLPRVERAIDRHYYQIGNQIAVRDKNLFKQQPEHIFIIIELLQRHSDLTAIAPKTLRAWWAAARKINRAFYENEANRRRFIGFFRHGRGLTRTMRFLNLYGVLGRYLPEWNKIVGLLQHDLFHIYPVDDHILTVLRNMRRLAMEQHVHELPFASAVMNAFDKKYLLYLAALFHDIGKGYDGDHSQTGAQIADLYARENDAISPAERDLLVYLVKHHLDHSHTAQKKDLADPATIAEYAARFPQSDYLDYLYLLTIADIRATNRNLWNNWRASLIHNLYRQTRHLLEHQEHSLHTRHQAERERAKTLIKNAQPAAIDALWANLPDAYYLGESAEHIAAKTEHLLARGDAHAVSLSAGDPPRLIISSPHPADILFARVTHYLEKHNHNIHEARLYTTRDHRLTIQEYTLGETPPPAPGLARELEAHIADNRPPPPLARRLPGSRDKHFTIRPRVHIQQEAAHTTLELTCKDRHGLLSLISRILLAHGVHISHAKISTFGEKAEDSFHLTDAQHRPLTDATTLTALQQALLDALQ